MPKVYGDRFCLASCCVEVLQAQISDAFFQAVNEPLQLHRVVVLECVLVARQMCGVET
jgi:hypothetical protein